MTRSSQTSRSLALAVALGVVVVASLFAWAALPVSDPERPTDENGSEGRDGAPRASGGALVAACRLPHVWVRRIHRGWAPGPARARDIIIVPRSGNYMGTFTDTSHSGPYAFLQDVPLVFYGSGFVENLGRWRPDREVTLVDLAPTQAAMMGFEWEGRDGQALTELIKPGAGAPPLVVTVSLDGVGWNVLRRWPDSWPNLARLMEQGASVETATVGSSPSITPAVHTTMAVGAYPRRHGVTAIAIRGAGGEVQGAFKEDPNDPDPPVEPDLHLKMSTLAEDWDAANGDRALVGLLAGGNYPLGLVGRGAALGGADRDIVAFRADGGTWATDARYYRMPGYLNADPSALQEEIDALDAADGAADGRWLGHDLDDTAAGLTPAVAAYERVTAEALIVNEGFGRDALTDLLYLHFKSPDHVGHRWNMISPEMRDVVASVDEAIGALQRWLDRNVGTERYVLVVTADHGQTPLEAGGWAIDRGELVRDLNAAFDRIDDGQGILEQTSATSLFTNLASIEANGVTAGEVASFLSEYTIRDNVPDGAPIPRGFGARADERVLAAAFPGKRLNEVMRCTRPES